MTLSWGGPGTFPHRFAAGVLQLEQTFGLHLVPRRHVLADADWIAAHAEARAEDLLEAFADPSIKAVISSIGGDDSIRLLPFLDYELMRAHPCGDASEFAAYDQALPQVVREEQGLVDLPVISQMDFGHTDPMFVLPYGAT